MSTCREQESVRSLLQLLHTHLPIILCAGAVAVFVIVTPVMGFGFGILAGAEVCAQVCKAELAVGESGCCSWSMCTAGCCPGVLAVVCCLILSCKLPLRAQRQLAGNVKAALCHHADLQ
jgi:hypothetical protein